MNDEVGTFFVLIFIVTLLILFGFALGRAVKNEKSISEINQKICRQLYQKDTNKYINCSSREIYKNIELIRDIREITNDK